MNIIIKITFRQIITADAADTFEKNIHHFSYEEFCLKCQVYNQEGKFKTFSEMKANDGRANSLHYKSGFAIDGFVTQLKQIIPHAKDTIGKNIAFEQYSFEVIESSIDDKLQHAVALHYTTPRLLLRQVVGDYMILGKDDETSRETFTIEMHPGVSVTFME